MCSRPSPAPIWFSPVVASWNRSPGTFRSPTPAGVHGEGRRMTHRDPAARERAGQRGAGPQLPSWGDPPPPPLGAPFPSISPMSPDSWSQSAGGAPRVPARGSGKDVLRLPRPAPASGVNNEGFLGPPRKAWPLLAWKGGTRGEGAGHPAVNQSRVFKLCFGNRMTLGGCLFVVVSCQRVACSVAGLLTLLASPLFAVSPTISGTRFGNYWCGSLVHLPVSQTGKQIPKGRSRLPTD